MSPEGGLTSIIDLCADKLAEETLVGGREKDREPHADEIVAVVEQFGRHQGVLSEIEARIADFGDRARNGKITPDDMAGGSFTISNGGVYGSLMSTPILNPPQSGILGMHAIQQRPVAVDGEVVIRPMMYVALSYDHRIIDGQQSVKFLVRLKELVEDPARLMLEV